MNLTGKSLCAFTAVLAMCALFAITTFGQSAVQLTQLRVRILDPSGGAVPGAVVTLFSDDRVRTAETDADGRFAFLGLSGPGRLLEVSAKGFRLASALVGDKPPNEISITLSIGECFQCPFLIDARERSVRYEQRSGSEQLSGTVNEYRGTAMAHASIVLMKADLNDPQVSASFANHNTSLNQRDFRYSFAAETISDKGGKFHFSGLESGWYSLQVTYSGYRQETRNFWIARENVTRPSPIEILQSGNPSPMRPAQEAPSVSR